MRKSRKFSSNMLNVALIANGDFAIFTLTKGLVNFGGGIFVTNNKNLYMSALKIMETV